MKSIIGGGIGFLLGCLLIWAFVAFLMGDLSWVTMMKDVSPSDRIGISIGVALALFGSTMVGVAISETL